MASDSAGRIGQLLGNYRIIHFLGQGGFADVYLGEHIHLKTQAAIKVLHTRLDEDSIENFRNEARTVAHLVHPNIVRVLEFGIEGTIPFLVMDYAPNGTLRQRHPRGSQVPMEVIISYVKQIATALQHAHDQRFIHRDIKPENILLSSKNEVLLSDFGIAVVTQSMRAQLSNQRTSDTAGTVSYMAPEQIQNQTVVASDQYALAIVIYEWLTGVLPFKGTYMEVSLQHIHAMPAPLREKVPTIAPALENVILTALSKDPQKRYPRIIDFANALEQAALPVRVPSLEASLISSFGRAPLGSAKFTIGRAQGNALVINDVKASSRHAEIRLEGPNYSIVDLGSMNGTFVNEQRINIGTSRLLNAADTIRIGDTTFAFEVRPGLSSPDSSTMRGAATPMGSKQPSSTDTQLAGPFPQMGNKQPNYPETQLANSFPQTPPYTPSFTPSSPLSYTQPSPPYTPPFTPSSPSSYMPPFTPASSPKPHSTARTLIFVILALVIILGAAGGFFVIYNNQVAQHNADVAGTASANANAAGTAIAHANATATALVTSPYPRFTTLTLNDSLTTNGSSGWDSNAACKFTSTGYQASIVRAGYFQKCFDTSTSFSDFAYQVNMTIVQGDCGGLLFRAADTSNFYLLKVCQDGLYSSVRFVNNTNTGRTTPTPSSAIHTGLNQVNTLAVVIQGNTFNFYVNGQSIGSAVDSTFTQGGIGVFAEDDTAPTTINYTNALVWT